MTEDRQMTQAELEAVLAEAQIGALQAYALFMEELVAAMLVARLCDTRLRALETQAAAQPELAPADQIERARADVLERDQAVRELFGRGAQIRLACAKVGALALDKAPTVDIPDPPPGLVQ